VTPDADEEQLVAYRALRDEAWALVRDDIDALKTDLERRGLGARLADRVSEEAHDVWEQTLEVAAAHRSIVAGTLIALVAWLLRGPIAQGVGALFGSDDDNVDPVDRPPDVVAEQGERT
jgi:hypothetical protein